MVRWLTKGAWVTKTQDSEGSTELGEEAAIELIEMAKTIRSSKERAGWLAAYKQYRFTGLPKRVRKQLRRFAVMFRFLAIGHKRKGG